ncbi:MAG: TfoX family protein [Rhizobiales bacterium TMED83]|nr:hypothetical protein [Rhodobiaceae bacterium]RPF93395.1 MAG: TfoX family protein [Rhizobiales bacterium TMED83]HCD16876.1 hypothetical protein [Rhodobiaceae bacterium]
MAVSSEYKAFVAEIFEPLGTVEIKHMFGGAGVYYHDVMFALIANETLYLKADGENQEMFEAAGADRFRFTPQSGKNAGKAIAMSYWELPEELLDDPEALLDWSRASLDAAFRAKAGKSRKA